MPKVTLFFSLNEIGRKASIAAGASGKAEQSLEVTSDQPEFLKALELADVDYKGEARVPIRVGYGSGYTLLVPDFDHLPTPAEILAAVEAVKRSAAEKQREYDAREAKRKEEHELALIEEKQRNEREQQEREARKAKKAADDAAEHAARTAWAAQHGSERLKKCLAENIVCTAIYRDERLALDRPGWMWSDEFEADASDPRNPPVEALDLLDEARKLEPECELRYPTRDSDRDEDDEEVSGYRGYCCIAEFLGRDILFGPIPAPETADVE